MNSFYLFVLAPIALIGLGGLVIQILHSVNVL